MASDAHAHPAGLTIRFPESEDERRRLGVSCAASAWKKQDFVFHEELARQALQDGAPPVVLCFAVHPQLPAAEAQGLVAETASTGHDFPRTGSVRESLDTLVELAEQGRLQAIGETGFDLYDAAFRETEAIQEELFLTHLEIAIQRGLPMVLHVRRAMHRVFAHTRALKKIPAVIFHSWPGTMGEGESLLRRGINAYFSFGTAIALNHKEAMRCCAALPADRLLVETDAPFQPLRGAAFSHWADLPVIITAMARLRTEAGNFGGTTAELETVIDGNWGRAFRTFHGT
jgi:TatD DNase family protein